MKKSSVFLPSVMYIQRKIKDVLTQVSLDDIEKVKELFFQSNHIFVYGAGRSGLVAKAFAIRFIHLGFQAFVIGETITVPVQKGDLVLHYNQSSLHSWFPVQVVGHDQSSYQWC